MAEDSKSNTVYHTNNTDKFSKQIGNRAIDQAHLARLKESIKTKNLLSTQPIVVNEQMEVIDGQHRLQAAIDLGLGIHYINVTNVDMEDVQLINSHMKNWGNTDFMEAYISAGNVNYKLYKEYKEKYKTHHTVLLAIFTGTSNNRSTGDFKTGRLVITSDKKELADNILRHIQDISIFFPPAVNRNFGLAIHKIVTQVKEYDMDKMLKQIEVQQNRMRRSITKIEYVRMLEGIYNYNQKNKVRFY